MAVMTATKSRRRKGSPPVRLMSLSEAGSFRYSWGSISPACPLPSCFQMSHITQRALQFRVTAMMALVGFIDEVLNYLFEEISL
jgi:hypothetical protein